MTADEVDLLPGERVLWTGVPVRHPVFDRADLFLVPFSLLWGGFSIFWEISTISSEGFSFMAVWGLPFVVVGLYLIVGRHVIRYLALRGTRYAVTDRRVIIMGGVFGRNERSAYLSELAPPVVRQRRADRVGSISFGDDNPFNQLMPTASTKPTKPTNPFTMPFMITGIENPRNVRDIIASGQATR